MRHLKKKIKKRNPYALALTSAIFRQKVDKDKRIYSRKNKYKEIKQALEDMEEQSLFFYAKLLNKPSLV